MNNAAIRTPAAAIVGVALRSFDMTVRGAAIFSRSAAAVLTSASTVRICRSESLPSARAHSLLTTPALPF